MQNVIRLANGGTVRIPAEIWEEVQQISVNLTVQKNRPIKESTVIKLLLARALENVQVKELLERIED
jgi:hypothetical protein